MVTLAASACTLSSCTEMSQQTAGQTGGLVGAGVGALATGALAKGSGASRGQTIFAGAVGGLAGYGIGQKIGQQNGAPGVYRTDVPNQ